MTTATHADKKQSKNLSIVVDLDQLKELEDGVNAYSKQLGLQTPMKLSTALREWLLKTARDQSSQTAMQ